MLKENKKVASRKPHNFFLGVFCGKTEIVFALIEMAFWKMRLREKRKKKVDFWIFAQEFETHEEV